MSNLIPVEYQGERILTTPQLAESYEADSQLIVNNFNRNKERYTEGKHYILLEGAALKEFKAKNQIDLPPNVNKLYLWPEKGAWLHAKSLNTDKAWEAYEMLVDDYYSVKKQTTPLENLSPQLQLLIAMELKQTRLETAITETKEEMQNIRDVVLLNPVSWREDAGRLIAKSAQVLGGNEHIRDLRKESYKLLDTRMGVSLETRLTNKRRRMADEGVCKSKRESCNHLDIIAEDKKLIEGYVAIVKEMAIKYGGTQYLSESETSV